MLTSSFVPAPGACRRAAVPVCDPSHDAGSPSIPPSLDGKIMYIKKGDVLDVGIDWSQWLAANNGEITESAWAAHSASPKPPTFEGATDLYVDDKKHTLVVLDTSEAVIGDIYYLTNTVTVEGRDGAVTLPSRTVKRTIHVRVVA